jgi:regulator of RNase E activity RraB
LSDEWDFYFGRVNGVVSSIFVDLGIRPHVPMEKRPWLLYVFVPLQSPTAEGLSSNGEGARLNEIGEALDANVSVACGAQLVGRITGAGRREFYFYGEEPGPLDEAVSLAMKVFGEYPHECGSTLEPDWDQYLNLLYPSDTNLQRMFNRRVLEALAENGDAHETPRPVDHWLEFPDEDSRAACRDTLVAIEFKVESEFLSEEPGDEMPFTLVVSRVDSVDTHTINGVTLELARLAQQHGGRYDGWESPAVSASPNEDVPPTTH